MVSPKISNTYIHTYIHLLRDFTDILRNPPADNPYTALSDAIHQRFGKSVEQRLRSLLSEQQLGDRRPSQFLRHLLDLAEAEGSQDSPIIREIFFNSLPAHTRPFLQCLPPGTDLATIASTADRLLELPQADIASKPTGYLAALTPTTATAGPAHTQPNLHELMHQLIAGVTALTVSVATLVDETHRRSRPTSRSPSRPRNHQQRDRSVTPDRSNTSSKSTPAHCWYHRKFGVNARSRQAPCTWTASGNSQ